MAVYEKDKNRKVLSPGSILDTSVYKEERGGVDREVASTILDKQLIDG
jgi:hypothetical protein